MTEVAKVRPTLATARTIAEGIMTAYAQLSKRKKKLDEKYKNDKLAIETELGKLEKQLEEYAVEHLPEFGDKKSLNLEAGTIGWKLLPGRLNFSLEADQKEYEQLIKSRYKDAVDIKVNTGTVIKLGKTLSKLRDDLAAIGVTIEQEDKFFVTPKL